MLLGSIATLTPLQDQSQAILYSELQNRLRQPTPARAVETSHLSTILPLSPSGTRLSSGPLRSTFYCTRPVFHLDADKHSRRFATCMVAGGEIRLPKERTTSWNASLLVHSSLLTSDLHTSFVLLLAAGSSSLFYPLLAFAAPCAATSSGVALSVDPHSLGMLIIDIPSLLHSPRGSPSDSCHCSN